jgi:hypothetical protein
MFDARSTRLDSASNADVDAVGNGNTESTSTDNEVRYDSRRRASRSTRHRPRTIPTTASPIHFTSDLRRPVTGFETGE